MGTELTERAPQAEGLGDFLPGADERKRLADAAEAAERARVEAERAAADATGLEELARAQAPIEARPAGPSERVEHVEAGVPSAAPLAEPPAATGSARSIEVAPDRNDPNRVFVIDGFRALPEAGDRAARTALNLRAAGAAGLNHGGTGARSEDAEGQEVERGVAPRPGGSVGEPRRRRARIVPLVVVGAGLVLFGVGALVKFGGAGAVTGPATGDATGEARRTTPAKAVSQQRSAASVRSADASAPPAAGTSSGSEAPAPTASTASTANTTSTSSAATTSASARPLAASAPTSASTPRPPVPSAPSAPPKTTSTSWMTEDP
ncbi:MAG: hypothetical protein HY908_22350 [Myxococcales bacterium]|nr:hypothetical protein [Myxococcales bacterium]